MRIDLNAGAQPAPESSSSSASKTRGGSSSSSPAGAAGQPMTGEDQARLSGVHVQALAAQVSLIPEVRQEKVQALRLSIRNGQYQTSAEKVAGAIMEHMIAGSAA